MAYRGAGIVGSSRIIGATISAGSSHEDVSIATAKQAVGLIVTHFEEKFVGFNINEIVKGGSLGHGTVVPGHYDLDLVVYSRDISGNDVLRSQTIFRPWVDELKTFADSTLANVTNLKPGDHSVQFTILYQGVPLDVDLLVSPYWNSPQEFYHFLRSVPKAKRQNFSVCASKWQVEFFKKQNNEIKEYIRRAKAWRNRVWEGTNQGKPRSYLMSLLVVKAYEDASREGPVGVTRALKRLVKNEHKDVYWADGRGDFYRLVDYRDLLPSPPRLIDPANPANNVWETGFMGDHSVLLRVIDTIDLSQPI